MATTCIPKVKANEPTLNVELCLQAVVEAFNFCVDAVNGSETGEVQGIDNEKLARYIAQTGALLQEWKEWKEEMERVRKEDDRQFYAEIVEIMNVERT